MRDILMWVLTVEVLGLACLPLLTAFFGNRRDAALLSRPVGLALVAYLAWALSLTKRIGFTRVTLLVALVLVAAASLLLRWSARRTGRSPEPFWGREERRAALFFWLPTTVFLVIRAAVPEVLGAEKFMDLAFFNSLTRLPAMPPVDPWMSGHSINYYYWGYLLAAVLAKISAVPTFVSYNLSVATFAGYSFVAAACLALRLSAGRTAAGIWAGIGAVFAGNLTGAFDAWRDPLSPSFDYWHASRVIASGNTINEFPFFTFFHADLHPHLLAFPFAIAVFSVAHRLIEIPIVPWASPWRAADLLRRWGPPLLVALLAGTARSANNWNLPVTAILLVFAGVFRTTQGRRLPALGDAVWGALSGAGILLLSLVLWLPYTKSYSLQVQGLGLTHMKSDLIEFLGVWGLLLAAGYASLVAAAAAPREEVSRRRANLLTAVIVFGSLIAAFMLKTPALVVLLPLAWLAARVGAEALRSPEGRPEDLFTAFALILVLGIIAGCEFIYFKDSYGFAMQRMNTIFKFYHQAWPLFAVAVAVLGERVWREKGNRTPAPRAALAGALLLSLFYPVDAAASRLRQHEGAASLDLRVALSRRSSADAAAIEWLLDDEHARPDSVLLEATGNPYSEFARISSHTGIPGVMGWANHESLWRSNDPEIAQRATDVQTFYTAVDQATAANILRRYHVTHVVLGDIERRAYPTASHITSFRFLEPVFVRETAIYRFVDIP